MRHLTQVGERCWQTCVAMLLDVAPESLPDQPSTSGHDTVRYGEVLRAYLHAHRDMTYFEVGPEAWEDLKSQGKIFHIMMGETVRTPANGVWHAVVGVSGDFYWDPHPSRAGLTKAHKWGVLVPFPEHWRAEWERRAEQGDEAVLCVCPSCVESRAAGGSRAA